MLLLAGLLLHLLAFGTLVAPVFSLQFNFATVQECAPILFSFSGLTSTVSRAPDFLTILPFNSTAIVVPLQNVSFSTGIALNLLPFAVGSEFLASLDDASGINIINISDILPVLPSPSDNSTCVPEPNDLPRSFTLASPVVSQCQNFTINYNTTLVSQAPSVRLYSPNGPSLFLNATSDDPISGVATYTMAFSYGRGITLLMDDRRGTKETTPLLTVGGDASSPTACLAADPAGTLSSDTSTRTSSLSSRTIAITGATIGGVAVLLVIGMAIFVLRHHRRRRAQHIHFDKTVRFDSFDKNLHNEKGIVHQVILLDDSPTGFVNTSKGLLSPEKVISDRNSLASWSQAIPEDQHHPASSGVKQSLSLTDRLSTQFSQIEGMLKMTTPQPNRSSINNRKSDPVIFGSPAVPQPALVQSPMLFRSLSGRHLRAPSDVPADMNSRGSAYSAVSTNSFFGHPSVTVTEPSSLAPTTPSSATLSPKPSSLPAPTISSPPPPPPPPNPSSLPVPTILSPTTPSPSTPSPSAPSPVNSSPVTPLPAIPFPTTPSLARGRSITAGFVGLPSSPRDGLRANVSRASSKRSNRSNRSIPEWYGGIAR